MRKLAEKLYKLNNELQTGEKANVEVLHFGLRLIFHSAVNYGLIFVLAHILGIFAETVAAVLMGSILKVFSGGAHLNSPAKCILFGTVIYLLMGKLAQWLGVSLGLSFPFWLLIGVVVFISVGTFAPAPAKNKPIRTLVQGRKLRNISRLVAGMALGMTFFMILAGIHESLFYGVLLGLLWQSISLWPGTYRVLENI
ncbi:MAG: accessory gene regulator B family protein [Clostridia bacterium]|nr:accessory gene regulator B family protein [Clostridia bacterium]